MTDKPTDKALENLFVEETGFDIDDFPAAIFGFARAVLAKRGQPAQKTVTVVPATGDVWLKHDDDLRYVRRVLEAGRQMTDVDQRAAIDIVHGLRVTARSMAVDAKKPAQAAEPVYAFRRKGLDDFCTCDEARYEELSNKPHLFETRVFYTAPQPVAREPMTNAQREKIIEAVDWYNFPQDVIDAVERAHGIKGGQHGDDKP